jgi:hypothetical protein
MLALIVNKIHNTKSLLPILLLSCGLMVAQTIEAKLFYDQLSRDISFSKLNERHELSGPVVNDIE